MESYQVDADGDIVMGDAAVLTSCAVPQDEPQMDGSYSAIFEVQHGRENELWQPRWDVGLGSGTWLGENGEVIIMDMPIEIHSKRADDVDVHRE
jgi:hypothetical protein